MVGPKLSLSVVGANLSLSQNLACHSKFRVCVTKPRGAFPLAGVEVKHLVGSKTLRHATVRNFAR